MASDPGEAWSPQLHPKQREVLDVSVPGTFQNIILVNGPRWSGKTWSVAHAICQHAWLTDRANICLLVCTQSVGIDSGIWQHLTEIFLPEWINANFGMEWVREPYVQGVTKKPACKVSNVHGNVSTISLESLKNEQEVEARFKGKSYSAIWVNELSKFSQRKTYDTLMMCLRMPHLQTEGHVLIADTNPCLNLGVNSWIYKLWYEFRIANDEELEKIFPDVEPYLLKPLQRRLKLIEFSVDDNLSLSPEKKSELMAQFAHSPELIAAYFYGRWVTASQDALFYDVFRPAVHVVGEVETASNPDPEILWPEEGCYELLTGQDPGATNYATVIMEKVIQKRGDKEVAIFKVLDELIIIGQDFDLNDYIEELVEKMEFWERAAGKPGKIAWRHWSDANYFDIKIPFSDRLWHQAIFSASGGSISLMAAEIRGRNNIAARVDMTRKLLWEERLFISRSKCPQFIQTIQSIKRGKNFVGTNSLTDNSALRCVIERGSKWKHGWDCASYCFCSEIYSEMNNSLHLNIKRSRASESTLVSVPV